MSRSICIWAEMSGYLSRRSPSYSPAALDSDSRPIGTPAASRTFFIDELLELVFTFCFDGEEEEQYASSMWKPRSSDHCRYPRPSAKEAPLLFTHVCRHWRNRAFDNSRLWARLHLEFPEQLCKDIPRMEGQLHALQFWLFHSGSIPISVRLRIGWITEGTDKNDYDLSLSRIPSESKTILTRMAESLFEHKYRWENIEIRVLEFGLTPFYGGGGQLPHLVSLKLETRCPPIEIIGNKLILFAAPNLRELALPGWGYTRDSFAPDSLPSNLQSLELSHKNLLIQESMCGSRLRKLFLKDVQLYAPVLAMFPIAFPLLEELSFIYTRDAKFAFVVGVITDEDYVVLDCLTTFRLAATGLHVHLPLDMITTPALKHLFLSVHTTSLTQEGEIIQFLHRSRAPVEYFYYEGKTRFIQHENVNLVHCDEGNIPLMLNDMPGLVELEIHRPALSSVLSFLRDPTRLPRLTRLYNAGDLCTISPRDGSSFLALSGPRISDILFIIHNRCRKHNEPDNGERVWLKELALPMHEEHERHIRESEVFRQAEVEFGNTHECNELIKGWRFEDYL